jgi:hypothetical protein
MRVSIEPNDVRQAAHALIGVEAELTLHGSRIRSAPLPAMPPGLAGQIAGELGDLGAAIGRRAAELRPRATDLAARARAAEIANGDVRALRLVDKLDGTGQAEFLGGAGMLAMLARNVDWSKAVADAGTEVAERFTQYAYVTGHSRASHAVSAHWRRLTDGAKPFRGAMSALRWANRLNGAASIVSGFANGGWGGGLRAGSVEVGAFAGMRGGVAAGVAIGAFGGPVGIVAGAVVGAVVGSQIGSRIGGWVGKKLFG